MPPWESADKLVRKEVIHAGEISSKPTELSVCHFYVENFQSLDLTVKQINEEYFSEIVDGTSKKVIIIGEACSAVDKFIERAIQTMSLKEQSLISVQIPADSTRTDSVVFSIEVTLESVKFSKPIWEWIPAEKYETASKYKAKGVELFKAKRYVDAFYRFSKACKILITLEPIEDEEEPVMKNIIDLKHILYNNMAECQLIRKNYDHVLTLCNKVLRQDQNNVKALYRRGTAYGGLRDFEKAANDLKTVMSLQPSNKQAQEKLNIYTEKWHASIQGYENMVRKMFKT